MAQIKKILKTALIGLCLATGTIGCAGSVYAGGGAKIIPGPVTGGGGGGGGSTNCSLTENKHSVVDCTGVSWIFYEASSAGVARTVTFPYIAGNRTIQIPSECAQYEDGGFWHYGVNIKDAWITNGGYNGQIGTRGDWYGHWSTRPWGDSYGSFTSRAYRILDRFNQSIDGLYTASSTKTGTRENVLNDYIVAWNYDNPDNKITEGNYADADSKLAGVGAFCWWPGMESEYLAKSNTSATDEDGVTKRASTNIAADESAETEIEVKVDSPLRIIFSHNPYSTSNEGTPQWNVYQVYSKIEDDGSSNDYTPFDNTRTEWFDIETGSAVLTGGTISTGSISESNKNGNVTSWDAAGDKYIGRDSSSSYTDGADNYIVRDGMNITFKQEGTWKFCETITVSDDLADATKQKAKTTVCVKVTVVPVVHNEYYSISNSKNDKVAGYKTTNITNEQRKVVSEAPKIKVNDDEVTMTFSHNIYSDRATGTDLVPWEVTRNWSDSGGIYTVTPVTTVTRSGSHAMNLREAGYYTVENSERHNDGSGSYYIVREIYKVKFTAEGSKEFCETVHVDGGEITTSCVKIEAEEEEIEIPELCAMWTPGSYNNSGDSQSETVGSGDDEETRNFTAGTTSVVTKIRNDSLTDDRGSTSAFSNWLGMLVPSGSILTGTEAITYAKPGDKITWVNCYYPGAQALYDYMVVDGNDDAEPQENNTLDEDTFGSQFDSWENKYKVDTGTDADRNGVFKVSGILKNLPNTVLPPEGASKSEIRTSNTQYALEVRMANGDTKVRQSDHEYKVQFRDDAGKYYTEAISTEGAPYFTQIDYEYHAWDGYSCPTLAEPTRRCNYYHENSFGEDGTYNYAEWSAEEGTLTSLTRLRVPYNFINTANFDIDGDDDDEVYAGDTIKVKDAEVTVNERTNGVTEDTYITQVDNAEVRLVAYISSKSAAEQKALIGSSATGVEGEQTPTDINVPIYGDAGRTNICDQHWLIEQKQCMEVNKYMYDGVNTINSPATTTLYNRETNTDPVTYGDTTGSYKTLGFSKDYNVFDASAGDYMCFAIAVFPWRSGPEGNIAADITTNPNGTEGKWLISEPKCRIIAKKPQLQVLGSSIYMGGAGSTVTASVSKKHNLYNISEYMPGAMSLPGGLMSGNPATYFGSFGEQSIVANGAVTRFASGAANGRTTANGSGYGARNDKLCESWSPLTFANYTTGAWGTMMCEDFEVAGYANITDASIVDREALVDYFVPASAAAEAAGSYSLGGDIGTEIRSGTDKNIRYVKASGDATITASTLSRGQTRVLKIDGKVAITGNIEYNGTFTSMADVPKAVIYASGNIEIGCNVKRVDAILIAGGTVYTCNNYTVAGTGSDMEDADRSREQLVINGLIISGDVELARTYGNAVGIESGTAAEVVNYDTSVLLWGRSAAGANDSNAMSTVYMHELAPRY